MVVTYVQYIRLIVFFFPELGAFFAAFKSFALPFPFAELLLFIVTLKCCRREWKMWFLSTPFFLYATSVQ